MFWALTLSMSIVINGYTKRQKVLKRCVEKTLVGACVCRDQEGAGLVLN